MVNISVLKKIAKNRTAVEVNGEDDLVIFLRGWWSEKFNLPDNHPLFWDKTLEEHVIDFYYDRYLNGGLLDQEKQEQQKIADEQWLKEQMGEDYTEECDYFKPPTEEEIEKAKDGGFHEVF